MLLIEGVTKKAKKIAALLVVAGLSFAVYMVFIGFAFHGWTLTPNKIIDPLDAQFNAHQFKFEDYPNQGLLSIALEKILVPGMPMTEVDEILVKSGGAKKEFVNNPKVKNEYRYFYRPWYFGVRSMAAMYRYDRYDIFVRYNDKGNLVNYFKPAL